jgi:hypothetical protein
VREERKLTLKLVVMHAVAWGPDKPSEHSVTRGDRPAPGDQAGNVALSSRDGPSARGTRSISDSRSSISIRRRSPDRTGAGPVVGCRFESGPHSSMCGSSTEEHDDFKLIRALQGSGVRSWAAQQGPGDGHSLGPAPFRRTESVSLYGICFAVRGLFRRTESEAPSVDSERSGTPGRCGAGTDEPPVTTSLRWGTRARRGHVRWGADGAAGSRGPTDGRSVSVDVSSRLGRHGPGVPR